MAKLRLTTLTLLIGLFITYASAIHTDSIHLHDDDFVSIHDPSITLPEPDSKRTILLPSEKPDSHPATLVDLDHHKENEIVMDLNIDEDFFEEEESEEDKKPFILRHHNCHHPHRHPRPHYQVLFRQFDGQLEDKMKMEERSYGNDMLVADPEMEKRLERREGDLENDMLVADPDMERRFGEGELEQDLTEIRVAGGGRRHAPDHWVGLHFGMKPRFPDHDEYKPRHHHHHHHHRHEYEENRPEEYHRHEHRRDEDEKRRLGGGLVKRFRKFLHNIDF